MRGSFALLVGMLVVVGSGCSSVRLEREDRLAIRTVYVDLAEKVEPGIEYDGGTLEGFDPFPVLWYSLPVTRELLIVYSLTPPGMWQVSRAYDRMSEAFSRRMERRGIRPDRRVRDHAIRRMRRLGVFPRVELQPVGFREGGLSEGEAYLDLDVRVGIAAPRWSLTPGVRPWIEIEGKLWSHDGRLIWQDSGEVSIYRDDVPSFDGQKLFDQPDLFSKALGASIPIAVADLIEKFRRT